MNNIVNTDLPNFKKEKMEDISSLLGAAKLYYLFLSQGTNILALKKILRDLKVETRIFGGKALNLMSHFENDYYWIFVDHIARRVLNFNPRTVLYSSDIFNSSMRMTSTHKGGNFLPDEVELIKYVAKNICEKFKNPSFVWQISENFSFQVKAQLKIGSDKWVDIPFRTDAGQGEDFEGRYKVFSSGLEKDSFSVIDVRSVFLAIMLPMRIFHSDSILLNLIVDRSEDAAASLMNHLYDILSEVLVEVKHVNRKLRDCPLPIGLQEPQDKLLGHRIGMMMNIVFEALSAWQENKRDFENNSLENIPADLISTFKNSPANYYKDLISFFKNSQSEDLQGLISFSEKCMKFEKELDPLSEKWTEFKKQFNTISNKNVDLIEKIQFLYQQRRLDFFLKNKHSWTWPDLAFFNEPGSIQIVTAKRKACEYSQKYFEEKTEGYDFWINMFKIVLVFLKKVTSGNMNDKYVDFQTNDEKVASYIYWIFMSDIATVENKIYFLKNNNIRRCIQEIYEMIDKLEGRKRRNNNKRGSIHVLDEPNLSKKFRT